MKHFLLFLFVFPITFFASAQIIKKQIGTSVWIKDGVVFADSTVSVVFTFDRQQRKIQDWQLYRNYQGEITDTNYVVLDTNGHAITAYFSKTHWQYEYDSLGNRRKVTGYGPEDTLIVSFHTKYNKKGHIISETDSQVVNGKVYTAVTPYSNKGRKAVRQVDNQYEHITKTNKRGDIIYTQIIRHSNGVKNTETSISKVDKKGNWLSYKAMNNKTLLQHTKHYFKKGLEQYQIEEHYHPNYTIITYFTYEYW